MRVGDIDAWVIDRLTTVLEDTQIRAGQVLFKGGDSPEYIYFMPHGEARRVREGRPIWIYRGRWLLGSFEALADLPYTGDTTAIHDFVALRIPRAAWLDLLEDSFPLARAAVVRTALGVSRLEERLPSLPLINGRVLEWSARLPAGPLDTVRRLAVLADVSMLRGPGVQVLTDLAAASNAVEFRTGDIVLPRGVERRELLVVVDGEIQGSRIAPNVSRVYGAGDLVCGAAAFEQPALAWEAIATMDTSAISFPVETWLDLMEEHFDLVRSTLTTLALRRELLVDALGAADGEIVLP